MGRADVVVDGTSRGFTESQVDFSCADGVLYGGYEAADPFSRHRDPQGRSLPPTGLTALKA